ncbi:MAG: twin-arginine translocation signal domain-containing protein, partial [Deferribacterales bacterium]|nr:twin-arginine translocation signal domain-containing protein [Deferribacterales bacterium]
MSLKEKLFDSRVSRRSFLKGMAAVGTTAAL